ncbi:S-layer homology domain-containing protein [Paenibacillus sp. Marseille-P2973]|uniref:S-layer homology domain-containing protein n=1 Tax=Paenibacillus sp. Marseille-P2973 TaxID=1871032 RepID=UPI001B391BB2|nr:S-layer homology domain-containing protein [Paenibacillus sp. Marseille-P2973]MBQ4900538.1 S-layer homology domain-containing protein [Paenibacillus sp. Marseille-P2973]
MKNQKLVIKVMTTAALLSALALPVSAATTLSDIDGSYAKNAIQELVEKGIINGKGDGKFDPTGKIERQDFAIILAKALNLDTQSVPPTATFSDVPEPHYAFAYIEAAVKAGLINGVGDGKFGTGANLSRQDMAVLFVRALGVDATGKGAELKFSDASKIADYAKDAVAAAVELGLISGNTNGTFNPSGNAERQAVAQVAAKFLKKAEELKNQTTPPSEETGTGSGTTQPQTPAPTTPPANTGNSGGGSSSGGGSNSGGGSTNPGTPVETELAQPTLSFSNADTIVITYSETLDTTHVPTTEDIKITGKDGNEPFPISIRNISIEGKSVFVKLAHPQSLDEEVEVSYKPLETTRAIRGTSGKLSPEFSNKKVVLQTEDPRVLLSQVIEQAQALLGAAEENTGNTTGKYPLYAVQALNNAVTTAIEVQQDSMATEDQIKGAINALNHSLVEFEGSLIQPLEVVQVADEFVLKPGSSIKIVAGDSDYSFNKQSIKDFIKLQRAGEIQDVYLASGEGPAFELYESSNGETIGRIELSSSDSQLVNVIKQSDGISILAAESATEQAQADLTFTVTEAGTVVKVVNIPVRFDNTKPTVTSATYDNGTMTVTTDEPLYKRIGSNSLLPALVNVSYSPFGMIGDTPDPHAVPLSEGTDFTISFEEGENTFSINLTSEFFQKFPPVILPISDPAFQIVFNRIGDSAGNKPDPVIIRVPAPPLPEPLS